MDRNGLKEYITEQYNCIAEQPWIKSPEYEVFRHADNQKWFAIIMEIPKRFLGIDSNEKINIVNLKCDPLLIGSLRRENGFFPAYHMNKENWITATLDNSISDDKLIMLLGMSYEMTSTKKKNK